MKQFSNKQRVCKNKTKRHNKGNKTRKGGAPTTTRKRLSRGPSNLRKVTTVTPSKAVKGTIIKTKQYELKPNPFYNKPKNSNRHTQQYFINKMNKEEMNKKSSDNIMSKVTSGWRYLTGKKTARKHPTNSSRNIHNWVVKKEAQKSLNSQEESEA